MTDETAAAHANPYIDESARTLGTNQQTCVTDTVSVAANSNLVSISRYDFQFNQREQSKHEHEKSSRNYNGGQGHTFGFKGRSTVHESNPASIEDCYLEKLQ